LSHLVRSAVLYGRVRAAAAVELSTVARAHAAPLLAAHTHAWRRCRVDSSRPSRMVVPWSSRAHCGDVTQGDWATTGNTRDRPDPIGSDRMRIARTTTRRWRRETTHRANGCSGGEWRDTVAHHTVDRRARAIGSQRHASTEMPSANEKEATSKRAEVTTEQATRNGYNDTRCHCVVLTSFACDSHE
jgi:hypothetical protein